jgi:hypothetical protein
MESISKERFGYLMPTHFKAQELGVRVMVFNATFNNISVILWQSVFLVDETGENHRPSASH